MESEQRNTVTESGTISPDTASNPIPDINGFLADSMSRAEPEESFTGASTRQDREGVSTDDLFEVLSNRRRRYVLSYLKETSPEVELGTLATQIAAWENNQNVSAVSGAERKRVYTSLQQVHLPKMDEIDILEFDKRAGKIEATSSLMGVELDPETASDDTVPWGWCYFTIAAVTGVVVGLSTLTFWPVQLALSPLVVGLTVVPFLLLSLVQLFASD